MSTDVFMRQIEAAQQRLFDLEQRASGTAEQRELMLESLEELSTAMEELHVASEELRQQNEELVAARHITEAERQRYQELFEFAPDGYLVTDPEGIIREANRAASALLGVRQDFLMGKPLLVFVAEPDQRAFHTRLTQLHTTDVIGRDLARLEIVLQPREGEPFPVSLTVGLVRNADDQLIGLRWLLRDITERVQAGKELVRLASFPELNPNPIIEVDLSGQVCYLNPAAKRLFPDLGVRSQHPWLEGLEGLADRFRAEALSSTQREITLGEACYEQTLHYVAEQQRVRIYGLDITERKRAEEALRKAYDELEIRVQERTLDLVKANDELRTEITEREQAQAAQRETEARFRTLAETTSAAIFITQGPRILYANPAATTITGYTSGELMDKPIWAVAHSAYQELLKQRGVTNQWLDNIPSRYELKMVTKDGEDRWLDITAGSIHFEGQPASVVTAFDITERDRAERALQKAKQNLEVRVAERTAELQQANVALAYELAERQRAEEAQRQLNIELQARNEALDAFAQTVAHDLKNPLNLILGYAEVLTLHEATLGAEERLVYVQTIASGARKMSGIINDLLLLAEVQNLKAVTGPLQMASIVAEARQRLAEMIKTHQAEIILSDPLSWPVAWGYDLWIEEVWVNYLSNALKYGGRPPRIELGAQTQPDAMARFWIHDNGPGLNPTDQDRLFAPFTQLNRLRGTGHGLGLSIVRRIVEKLGGRAGVESAPGQGSTFFFTLPTAGPYRS
jgi:PAS domain S-box-containing protein